MRWDEVVEAMKAALDGDAELAAILGSGNKVHPLSSTASRTIPMVRYFVPVDVEEEIMNPITVQLDYWANGVKRAIAIERRIRAVLSHPVRRVLGGVSMWTLFQDARDSSDPEPGVVHRQLDFRFVPVRSIYT